MIPSDVARTISKVVPDLDRLQNLYRYGSRIYGTSGPDSDADYIAVMSGEVGQEHTLCSIDLDSNAPRVDVTLYDAKRFRDQLANHEISVVECLFLPPSDVLHQQAQFAWTLDRSKLREALSAKASNSFVKAKKKFEVEKQPYIAKKSLWHSLRILNFGIQLATSGKVQDFQAANHWWVEIRDNASVAWEDYKVKYQPVYNELKSAFRKVAPLAEEN